MLQKYLVILLLWLAFNQSGYSDHPTSGFLSIQLENDFLGNHEDRFYTHGTKLSFSTDKPPPDLLRNIIDRVPFYQKGHGELVLHGYEIGQTIFTPGDISETQLIKGDRPYAGWLFLNFGIGHIVEDLGDSEKLNFLLLTVGLVGPSSFSEYSQKVIHNLTDSDDPKGWNNQLHDELGINASYLIKYRKIYDFDEPHQTELGKHVGVTLGNVYSYAAAGFIIRYGTHLKSDIGPPSILPGFIGTPSFNPTRESHWYVFAGFEGRLMARNIFLDGNTFVDSHRVDKEFLVGDIQFGFAYHINDMRVSFTQMIRTREFEKQDGSTQFGAINFTFYSE